MRIAAKLHQLIWPLLLAALALPPLARGEGNSECLACHAEQGTVADDYVIDPAIFDTTAHAELGCPTCHPSVGTGHPDDGLPPAKASCQDCHDEIAREYARSTHYASAVCHDCHNPHQVRGVTAVSGPDMNRTCSHCHATDVVASRHTAWLPQSELHIAMLPCVSCHTASQQNVITLYIVRRQSGTVLGDFDLAGFSELQELTHGRALQSLIDSNEDNYISLAELRLFNLDPGKSTLRLQGMMTPESVTHDFSILANRRDCSFCHASGPNARQTSFVSLAQSDGSYRRVAVEQGAVLDALHGTPDFYMVGATRSTVLNYIGAAIIAGGLIMPLGHGTLRFLTRRNRKDSERGHDHD